MTRTSSVPDREFDRPQTISDLQFVLFTAMTIISNVCAYLSEDRSGAWQIVHMSQGQVTMDIEAVDRAARVGVPEWQKARTA